MDAQVFTSIPSASCILRTMFIVAILGGSLGVYAGMEVFRHKTKHAKFTVGVPLILAIQIILSVFIVIWMQK